jgi:hypothetical protein
MIIWISANIGKLHIYRGMNNMSEKPDLTILVKIKRKSK